MAAVRITSATGRTGLFILSSLSRGSRAWGRRVFLQNLRRDHHLLDFGRSFVDLGDAGVAPEALHRELGEVSITAVHLDGQVRGTRGGLGGMPFGERSFLD